jgi:hypothetical protein
MKDTDTKKNHIINTSINHAQWMKFRSITDHVQMPFARAKRYVFELGLQVATIDRLQKFEQCHKMEKELAALKESLQHASFSVTAQRPPMSPEARKKISEAQKRHWAAKRNQE